MNKGQLPTNQLHDINWGAFDHASHTLQLMSLTTCTMCVYVCVDRTGVCSCVCMCICICVCVCVHGQDRCVFACVHMHVYVCERRTIISYLV